MHPVILEIAGFSIPAQPLVAMAALIFGIFVYLRHGRRLGTHWKILLDVVVAVLVVGLVFSRLYVLLLDPQWFQEHSHQILTVSTYGLHAYGAIIGGLLGVWVVSWWFGYPYFRLTDLVAFVLPLVLTIFSIGSFMQGADFGDIAPAKYGVVSTDAYSLSPLHFPRHPTGLYMAALMIGLYFFFLKKMHEKIFHGYFTALFLIFLPLAREALSPLTSVRLGDAMLGWQFGGVVVTVERFTSLLVVTLGIGLFFWLKSKRLVEP